jgi:pimeloyl-ACP methyl ester carboxylesterase
MRLRTPAISALLATLLATLLLASCTAPISYRKTLLRTPVASHQAEPLSDALRELEAGKSARDPHVAGSHFIECARLAGNPALSGEPGARALYNQATGLLVELLDENQLLPWDRSITLGGGRTLRGRLEPGARTTGRRMVNVESLEFAGVYASIQATRPGLGAPLVAISPPNPEFRNVHEAEQVHKALTAILRFDHRNSATLELHDPLEVDEITIAGRRSVLAADFSAPVSMLMAETRPDKLGLTRLLNPQKYSHTARLTRLQDHDSRRTPVLFVHGLDSTPATWTLMYHSLMQDPGIRKNYQFWVFSYPSGYPYPYSASLLRKELDGVRRAFPDSKDMVIIGHSMGGMISRLMVTDADDRIWRGMFGMSPAETRISGASRGILEDAVVFNHRDEIATAIFIAAPHRGSELSNHFIGRMFSRLVRLPTFITDTRNAFASVLTVDEASLQLDRAPNSIDTLSPNNRFVREVNKLPIARGVTYHSIMGDRGRGDTPASSDGVVPYWSSHLEGAASETIVPSGHSAHEHPEAIGKVRRILISRLKSSR